MMNRNSNRRKLHERSIRLIRSAVIAIAVISTLFAAAVLIYAMRHTDTSVENSAQTGEEAGAAEQATGNTRPFNTYNVPLAQEALSEEPEVRQEHGAVGETSSQDAPSDAASTEETPAASGASVIYMPNGAQGDPVTVMYTPGTYAPLVENLFLNETMLFAGWSRSAHGSEELLSPRDTIYIEADTPVTLYAQWIAASEGSLVIEKVDVSDGAGRVDYSNGVRSDDSRYRLYVVDSAGEHLAAEVPAAPSGTIAFAGENLYSSSFVIRAMRNGELVNICDVQQLFRIEDTDAGLYDQARVGIKGIMPHPNSIHTNDLEQLGVRQVIYNLYLSYFLDARGGQTVSFEYNGRTYSVNAQAVSEYDSVVGSFAAKGLTITMVVLSDTTRGANPLIHQTAHGAGATLYALATTPEALETERALGAFFANRYPEIKNWIIGNEIDAWQLWNYMNVSGMEEYVTEYSRAFRAFYDGIMSANGNARVYISLTQNWTGRFRGQYRGRDIVDMFASMNRDIYWHLAYHPYGWPMTDTTSWDSPNTSMSFDTQTITMENISVLTTYMGLNRLRNPDGSRKSIILSEFGYTSSGGKEQEQAASIVYSYRQALRNPYIDAFLLAREVDDASEIAQGLATGIRHGDGSRKLAWNWYAAMGTADEEHVVREVYSYIGQ